MDKSKSQYMEGDKLTCPSCGSMEFCIGKDDMWTNGELYADCTSCLTSTLVRLLKQKYRKNMRDFDLEYTETVGIDYECKICHKIHFIEGTFKEIHYFGTMCTKFEPEPEDWKCPQHPTSEVDMTIFHHHH